MVTNPPPLSGRMTSAETVRTFTSDSGESCAGLVRRMGRTLAELEEIPLMVMCFGRGSAIGEFRHRLAEIPGGDEWPVLVVDGEPCHDGALAGVQVFTLPASGKIRRVRLGERAVGSVFEDGDARHCLLAGIGPVHVTASEGAQTAETFALLGQALEDAGFAFEDLVRTWFYNRDILAWYDEFNRVRSAIYRLRPFCTGSSPASTGIEGNNPDGAALTLAAWAVKPLTTSARVREIGSPLQCPAPAYGSTFSRAMEINSGGRRRLLVSGTASIAPGGESVWPGDPVRQIDLSMDVIEAILRSRQLEFTDVVRATAYFKHAGDLIHFQNWLLAHGLEKMPYVPMHCDVCRDDLLFELELDACR